MEKNVNIVEILKNKPEKTILYDAMRDINVSLYVVEKQNGETNIFCDGMEKFKGCSFVYSDTGADSIFRKGMQLLKPSKEMQDWEKFSWKRGDVLISDCGFVCIFKEWASDDYTKFNGCYFDGMPNAETAKYSKLDNNTAYGYIREIENRCGGKLNLETLEIEKQPEFKDGDILYCEGDSLHLPMILILKILPDKMQEYAYMNNEIYDRLHICCDKTLDAGDISRLRYATEGEKQHLFNALAKKGKAWDAGKKEVVDLKPKCEFKPMDLCLMKYIGQYNNRGWELCQYAYTEHRVSSSGEHRDFYHSVGGEIYAECIPYNEDTEHLLGTRDKWKGGEQ